jgi:hypothetical protein
MRMPPGPTRQEVTDSQRESGPIGKDDQLATAPPGAGGGWGDRRADAGRMPPLRKFALLVQCHLGFRSNLIQ